MQTNTARWVALGVAIAWPAVAQEHPLMQPSRDVMVEYQVSGRPNAGPNQPHTIRMYYSDHGTKMRVEALGQPGYSIADRAGNRTLVVMPQQHMYMEMPYDPTRAMAFEGKDGTFTRRGTDTVAGVRCTVYHGQTPRHTGDVCLTDDGLLLRAKSDDPGQGGDLVAIAVTYGAQPASLFEPPPGFQKMDMANMAHMPPGAGGGPPRQ